MRVHFILQVTTSKGPLPEEEEGEYHQSLSEEKEDFNPVWISQNLN
jgi:hypothetical protein